MKISRRSLLAGCAGTLAGMLVTGPEIAAATDKLAKPAVWKMEVEMLSVSMPVRNASVGVVSAGGRTILTLADPAGGTRDMALNDSGRMIWSRCDGRHTVKQIADEISRVFDIESKQAYTDCMTFLFHLKKHNAILV